MLEDIEMTIERLVFIEFGYKKSTSFFDMDETIIRETELDTLTFEDDLFGIYDESGLSSKKRKRDINKNINISITFIPNILLLISVYALGN